MLSSYYPVESPFMSPTDPTKLIPTPFLPPTMRSRSSSTTSSELSPCLSSTSDTNSLCRNNSTESGRYRFLVPSASSSIPAAKSPPPRSPLPPTPRSTTKQSPSPAAILSNLPKKRPPLYMAPTVPLPVVKHTLKTMISSSNLKAKRQLCALQCGYILDNGPTEQDRLVAQHYLLRMMLGGDFRAPVVSALSNNPSAIVLDVGCGPGAWTMEMATAYPRASFIGIDRDMYFPSDIKPKNCHFRQFEITNGKLPFPDNSFNYIHQRDLNWALTTDVWKTLLAEYMRILKPGGWIELVEPDVETKSSLSLECAMNDKLLQGMIMRQQDPQIARHLPTLLAGNGFRRVQSQFQSLPLGWDKGEDDNNINSLNCPELARLSASQYLFLLQSLRPWLSLVMNLPIDKFNNHIMGLPQEWRHGQTYINWHCAVAQKPHTRI